MKEYKNMLYKGGITNIFALNSVDNMINNYTIALNVEITAQFKNRYTVPAANGKLLNSVGSIFIYKFELLSNEDVPDDMDVEVYSPTKSFRGTIIHSIGLEVVIAFSEFLGDSVPQIQIVINRAIS